MPMKTAPPGFQRDKATKYAQASENASIQAEAMSKFMQQREIVLQNCRMGRMAFPTPNMLNIPAAIDDIHKLVNLQVKECDEQVIPAARAVLDKSPIPTLLTARNDGEPSTNSMKRQIAIAAKQLRAAQLHQERMMREHAQTQQPPKSKQSSAEVSEDSGYVEADKLTRFNTIKKMQAEHAQLTMVVQQQAQQLQSLMAENLSFASQLRQARDMSLFQQQQRREMHVIVQQLHYDCLKVNQSFYIHFKPSDVVYWLINQNFCRFVKYEDVLLARCFRENVDGRYLRKITFDDLERLGVADECDRCLMMIKINELRGAKYVQNVNPHCEDCKDAEL